MLYFIRYPEIREKIFMKGIFNMLCVWNLYGAEKDAERQKQEKWFDSECLKQLNFLLNKNFSKEEIIKKFEVTYCEQKYHSRFLLDDILQAYGYEVTRHHFKQGDVVIITVNPNFRF